MGSLTNELHIATSLRLHANMYLPHTVGSWRKSSLPRQHCTPYLVHRHDPSCAQLPRHMVRVGAPGLSQSLILWFKSRTVWDLTCAHRLPPFTPTVRFRYPYCSDYFSPWRTQNYKDLTTEKQFSFPSHVLRDLRWIRPTVDGFYPRNRRKNPCKDGRQACPYFPSTASRHRYSNG